MSDLKDCLLTARSVGKDAGGDHIQRSCGREVRSSEEAAPLGIEYGVEEMDWRRGFIRLWLAVSAVWLIIIGIVFSFPQSLIEVTSWRDPGQGQSLKLSTLEAHIAATANLRSLALYGFGLPVIALVLGFGVRWIHRGFRPEQP